MNSSHVRKSPTSWGRMNSLTLAAMVLVHQWPWVAQLMSAKTTPKTRPKPRPTSTRGWVDGRQIPGHGHCCEDSKLLGIACKEKEEEPQHQVPGGIFALR